MIKLRVSYEYPEELERVLAGLRPWVKSWKIARRREGKFRKAYIILKDLEKL